jgi:RHS repeat-associated protein
MIEYVYDPLGRKIAIKIDGVITEKYLWQGLTRLLAVYDGSNNLLMRFEYADGRLPMAMTKGGSTYYLTYDQVGSLRVVADASGNVVKRIDYDSFGNIIDEIDPTFEVPFGFAGGLDDQDTGLIRFGYRDYDPDTGRWTAKDPIFCNGEDADLYGYCLNNPVDYIDPFGLWDLISSYQALHGSKPDPRHQFTSRGNEKVVKDFPKLVIDETAQRVAVQLSRKYLGLAVGSTLQKVNFVFGIFDPFPPPAGDPSDMIFLEPMTPTQPTDLPWENDSPCK